MDPTLRGASAQPQPEFQTSTPQPSDTTQIPERHCPRQNTPPYCSRRHTGKVGRLPHATRERINQMLRDGLKYREIIESLGEAGKGLTHHNLKQWRKRGHQQWLQEMERRERCREKEQFALDVLRQQDASKLHEAFLQLAATELCQLLADFDASSLREKIQQDPRNFVRLLNALPKISESGLKCELHRAEIAKRQQKLEREKSGNQKQPGLTPETIQRMEDALKLL